MKKLKIKLEYGCFPVWEYDESGKIVDNCLPSFLEDNELDVLFFSVQEKFDALYLDNKDEFRYIGFESDEDRRKFWEELRIAVKKLEERVSNEYIVEARMDEISKRMKKILE